MAECYLWAMTMADRSKPMRNLHRSIEFEFKFGELNVIYYCSTMRHSKSSVCVLFHIFHAACASRFCFMWHFLYLLFINKTIYCAHILYYYIAKISIVWWYIFCTWFYFCCAVIGFRLHFTSNYFTINFGRTWYNVCNTLLFWLSGFMLKIIILTFFMTRPMQQK